MTVGIVGLGLIGGSLAKAYKASGHTVLGLDINPGTLSAALADGAADAPLAAENTGLCDLLLIALCPGAAIAYLEAAAPRIPRACLVIDCCGVKRAVCEAGFRLSGQYGFTFAGGHPMAGSHLSGFANSRAGLFKGASMVIVPPARDDMALLSRIREMLLPLGLGRITISDAQTHDDIIAFTSQLAHIVSGAYIKSPAAPRHKGFSAGSYKDMTRVATLSPDMWTELFIDNRDNLTREVEGIIMQLTRYRDALRAGDAPALHALLEEGRLAKKEADGL